MGVLRDLGAHALNLAFWFFEDITPNSVPEINDEATISFKVKCSNDIEGQIETSWCKKEYRLPETGLIIEGTEGTLSVTDDKVEVKSQFGKIKNWYRQDLNDDVDFLLVAPEYYREDLNFIRCVRNNEHAKLDFLEASKVDKLIQMVTR